MARRDRAGVRLITHHGNDFTARFPLAVEAVTALSAQSFLLDGEAIVTNDRGLAVFDLIRHQRHGDDAVLIAFDLIGRRRLAAHANRAAQAHPGKTGAPSTGRDCRERDF
jgi:ATP-dependent DNA ligase